MADPIIFRIVDGQLGLLVVDRSEVGYSDTWRAPGGKSVDEVTLADYEGGASQAYYCQVTQARITATANSTSETIEATMCAPERTVPQQGESSFAAEIGAFQDLTAEAGLSRFAFENDAAECYLYIGFDGVNPPKAIGRVIMASLPIGGTMRSKLLDTATWPFVFKPQIEFGTATSSVVVPPEGTPATGATAGSPGTWTPSGSTPPADAADATSTGVVASPATAWTTGQYVQGSTAGTGGQMYWNGTAWTSGQAALAAADQASGRGS